MYNSNTLTAGLLPLIGWRQNEDPSGVQLNALTSSTSGLYYNDQHPLLSFDNLLSIAPYFELVNYPAWSGATSYSVGAKISHEGALYIAVDDSLNEEPPNALYWAVYSPFTEWLKQKTEAGILAVVEDWISRKFQVKTAKNLLSRKQVFATTPRLSDLDENVGEVVGFEFLPNTSRNTVAVIGQIGLSLSVNQNLLVSLFAANNPVALETQLITYDGDGAEQWTAVNWELPGGTSYYVVYEQADLSGQSINGARSYNSVQAGGTVYPQELKGVIIQAFRVPGDTSSLWDIEDNIYTGSTNYGLNFRLSVHCDYTTFLLEQKDLFKGLLAKGVAMALLRELAYNPNSRVNRHESNASLTQILYEIDGDSQGRPGGLRFAYEGAMQTAALDDTGIEKTCLPIRKRSVNYRTI